MILNQPHVSPAELERRTGWAIKPQGACKADRCVPLPEPADSDLIDVRVLAERLGMPVIYDEQHGLWALGPEAGGRSLLSAAAPEVTLPTREGQKFSLSSLRGTKVLLLAWASW
jgi:hypothetical protein